MNLTASTINNYITKNYSYYLELSRKTYKQTLFKTIDNNRHMEILDEILLYLLSKTDQCKVYNMATGNTLNLYVYQMIYNNYKFTKIPYLQYISKELQNNLSIPSSDSNIDDNSNTPLELSLESIHQIEQQDINDNEDKNEYQLKLIQQVYDIVKNDENISFANRRIYLDYIDKKLTFKEIAIKYKLSVSIVYSMYKEVNKYLKKKIKR